MQHMTYAWRITYNKKVVNDVVKKCYKPVEKKCSGEGQEICSTVYQTYCTTKYVQTKQLPQTECHKQPLEVCGAGCDYKEGAEECHEKVIATVVEEPEELTVWSQPSEDMQAGDQASA